MDKTNQTEWLKELAQEVERQAQPGSTVTINVTINNDNRQDNRQVIIQHPPAVTPQTAYERVHAAALCSPHRFALTGRERAVYEDAKWARVDGMNLSAYDGVW